MDNIKGRPNAMSNLSYLDPLAEGVASVFVCLKEAGREEVNLGGVK